MTAEKDRGSMLIEPAEGGLSVTSALSTNGKAALHYARQFGWAVLPVHAPSEGGACSCGDSKCANIGKHPRTRHGLKDSTTDQTIIARWWSDWPDANIGLALGKVSGIVAVDVDPRHDGDATLATWRASMAL